MKKLDLYIIRKFLGTFFFSMVLILSIVVVFDLSERLEKFLENKAPLSLVQEEKRKAMAAGGLAVTRFGMISSSGFEENTDQAVLITGDDLYASCLKI